MLGVKTNMEFLEAVLRHPDFAAGRAATRFVEQFFPAWESTRKDIGLELVVSPLADGEDSLRDYARNIANEADPHSPWASGDAFRRGSDSR